MHRFFVLARVVVMFLHHVVDQELLDLELCRQQVRGQRLVERLQLVDLRLDDPQAVLDEVQLAGGHGFLLLVLVVVVRRRVVRRSEQLLLVFVQIRVSRF